MLMSQLEHNELMGDPILAGFISYLYCEDILIVKNNSGFGQDLTTRANDQGE
jgi:hypothetical protein